MYHHTPPPKKAFPTREHLDIHLVIYTVSQSASTNGFKDWKKMKSDIYN
jgi:hypothetical protein